MNFWPKPPPNTCHEQVLLCAAVRDGNIEKVAEMLATRQHSTLYSLDSALYVACDHHHTRIAQLLLAAGADPNVGPYLCLMAEDGDVDMVDLLLTHGASIHAHNEAALLEAVDVGDVSLVALLLSHGANPRYGHSKALAWASATRNQEVFDLLYPLSDPEACVQQMHAEGRSVEHKWLLEERLRHEKAQQQHTMLTAEVHVPERPRKKVLNKI